MEEFGGANGTLGWKDVLAPHMTRTEMRMAQHPVVLCLQDTTELDFNGQDMDRLGRLCYEAQRGMSEGRSRCARFMRSESTPKMGAEIMAKACEMPMTNPAVESASAVESPFSAVP